MKICALVIFAVLVTQSSASLFDTIRGAFQPLGNCVGKLYNDIVSDLKQTIDCTVMAVEHAFSWKTMFGRNADYYEEMCTGRKKNATKSFNEAYNVASKDIAVQEQSVNQLQNTIEKSPADENERKTIEEAFVNETLRLQQIHKIICEELKKVTNGVEKGMNIDEPSAETVLGEVKQLYEIEQHNRTSARANEVRNTFDKVLTLLQVNDTGGGVYSDDEEVKVIMKGIGKSLGNAVDDVEKKFMEWKQENNKLLQTLTKNITLEHNGNELSPKQDKDGSKLKRQSANFVATLLNKHSKDSQNKSETIGIESQLIPILNPPGSQLPKTDQINKSTQSGKQTKESVETSSKGTHHNSTDDSELSRHTNLSMNQFAVNDDTLDLRTLMPNNENLEQRESSLQLAVKLWNPRNQQVSNATIHNQSQTKPKDSNAPEYTQLTLKGIQFRKAADILNSSQENKNRTLCTSRQSTEEKTEDISGESRHSHILKVEGDRFADLPKDPIKGNGQLIQANNASLSPDISKQTNILMKVLVQGNQNVTDDSPNDSHSTEAIDNKQGKDSRRVESNLRSNDSVENESPKTSLKISKIKKIAVENNSNPLKQLSDSQFSISESFPNYPQLNINHDSKLKNENTQDINISSQIGDANKTELVKPYSRPSNATHELDTKQENVKISSIEINPEASAQIHLRLNLENEYKNQTNINTTSASHSKTTQDDFNLNNSTCLNPNVEIVRGNSSQSINATENLNLAQIMNETVNISNVNKLIQNRSNTLLPINKITLENSQPFDKVMKSMLNKKENIQPDDNTDKNSELEQEEQKDLPSTVRNKQQKTESKQQSVISHFSDKTSELNHENIQIKNKSDNISENSQTLSNPDSYHSSDAPSSSEGNLEARLEPNQNLVTRNNSNLLQKETLNLTLSSPKRPIKNISKPLNNDINTEFNKNSNLINGTGNYSEAAQPSNLSLLTKIIKENIQSLSAQKTELLPDKPENPEEAPGCVKENKKLISSDNLSDMMSRASQPSIAENIKEKKQLNNDSLIALDNLKIKETNNSGSAELLKQESNNHTNVDEKADLKQEQSVENNLQTNEEHKMFFASNITNTTYKSKTLINSENKNSETIILPVNQGDNQPVHTENILQNDTINTPLLKKCSIPDSEALNTNLTTELITVGNLFNSSMKDTELSYINNSSEFTKSGLQGSQEILNVSENLTANSALDDNYYSQNKQNDTKLASAGTNLSYEISTRENATLESPDKIPQENNYSDISQMIQECTNSSNKPVSQIKHSNGDNESLHENLQWPQNNAAVVSHEHGESSKLETLEESTQLTQESFSSDVIQVPPENRIKYSTVASIMNTEDEQVPSPTFNKFPEDPAHSFEGQMITHDSYVPSPRFNHVLNKQTTPFVTEPDLVRVSDYSNQNLYVPDPFYAFDQSTYPTDLPNLAPEWQTPDNTFSERSITNEKDHQQPVWSSFAEDVYGTNFMSTEKPDSFGFPSGSMFDIESIIQDSRRSESLMENLFSNMDHEHNVFEEPDMLYN